MTKHQKKLNTLELNVLLLGLTQRLSYDSKGIHSFCYWDPLRSQQDLKISSNLRTVRNTATKKCFRTAISKVGLSNTIDVVEFQVVTEPDKPVKVGFTTDPNFPPEKSFSDCQGGFAFYTLGQLRKEDHAKGRL